jgi:hypothetical protein
MKRLRTVLTLVALLCSQQVFGQINTAADDYAASFRTTSDGKLEFWFTSSRLVKDGRSRSILVAPCVDTGFGTPVPAESPVNHAAGHENDVTLDGTPCFAACNGAIGVFGSNRLVSGRYYGNDIYELRLDGSKWNVRRIDEVSSGEWDDSPALNATGTRMYFASDRQTPGTRKADLYLSEWNGTSWSAPRFLDDINTSEFSEETPFVGEDGYLYYSTNRNGDYDIYRVRLNANGLPDGTPEPLPIPGVNKTGSDETHPSYSAGGAYFVYSSNMLGMGGRKHDFDILWKKIDRSNAKLEIDVRKRRRQTTERVGAMVHFRTGNYEKTIRSTNSSPLELSLSDFLQEPTSPAGDTRYFETYLQADPDSANFVTSHDTLVGYRNCLQFAAHTLFLWDTATYYEQRCVDTFPIKKVQYFVTGYWCPTTQKYDSYMECPTLFTDPACMIPVCKPGDLDSFHVERIRLHSECIDYPEFNRQGPKFASDVDDAIEQHLKAMESAFGSACMKRTIAQHKPVRVVVEGFTDPRGYSTDCHYFGPDIDFTKSFVQVPDSMKSHFMHDTRMKKYGYGGNQLLSELRAYNLAVLLDKLWTEKIDQYRELKEAGLLQTIAIGRAVSQDDFTFEQRRSAQVSVNAVSEGTVQRGEIPQPGERVLLCMPCR